MQRFLIVNPRSGAGTPGVEAFQAAGRERGIHAYLLAKRDIPLVRIPFGTCNHLGRDFGRDREPGYACCCRERQSERIST